VKVRYAGNTNVGMKRTHNEDSLYLVPQQNIYIVADGMGGHSSGEVASQLAVESIAQFFKETAEDEDITWPYKMDKDKEYQENRVVTGIKLANKRIFESQLEEPRLKGMGTTVVVTYFANGGVYIGHVGDSRVYRVRGNEIAQMTEDHSLLNDYIKMKELTPEEIENFPHKNVIVRALGMKETVQVDTMFEIPHHGDIYLLCSDGLSGMIDDNTILKTVVEFRGDLEETVNKLIERANENGGTDNITAVLSEFLEG
jgi:serine/threonine protein phosphatase PrpC